MKTALSVRSDFSIGESLLQLDQLVKAASEQGYKALGLVDTNLCGMVDFVQKCEKVGIKPIVGARVEVVDDPTYRTPSKASGIKPIANNSWTAKIYLKSEKALPSVFKMLTKASSKEYFYYKPRIGLKELLELEDVVVTTGDFYSLFTHPQHSDHAQKLHDKFGEDFYVETCLNPPTPLWERVSVVAARWSLAHPTNILQSRPVLYADTSDAESLDVLQAVTTNTQLDAPFRSKQWVKNFDLSSGDDWGCPGVAEIYGKCNFSFNKMTPSLPVMAKDEFANLVALCKSGWKNRFEKPVSGYKPDAKDLPIYKERLVYELGVLKKMNFSGYFLLVQDLVMWAKSNGIFVGPGRGSVGGSLVAYLIGITDVDPIRFNLLFERFINPDRIDLPDADLDFMSSKRHLIQDYLIKKYGSDRVAGISNFSTLASASAIRDVGRVHGLNDVDLSATKLVPKEHGVSASIEEAAKSVPEIDRFKSKHPDIWRHALNVEGVMRSFGQHAAGIVVAGEPIVSRAPLITRNNELPVVAWDKRTVEDWGLIKLDILGLATLDVLQIAKEFIMDTHGIDIDYLSIPLDDEKVLDAFGSGDTGGVFQSEGAGARRLLKDMAKGGRLSFEDIVAMNALNRPGPLDSGLAATYVRRRQGIEEVRYPHPRTEPALKNSLGVMVYQESLMQIARDLCGFTMAEADLLRKAVGKKDAKLMRTMKEKFIAGAIGGYVRVTLDNGEVKEVHTSRLLRVKGKTTLHTIEEIVRDSLELDEIL